MQQHVSNQLGALLQQPLSCRLACGAEGNQGDMFLDHCVCNMSAASSWHAQTFSLGHLVSEKYCCCLLMLQVR